MGLEQTQSVCQRFSDGPERFREPDCDIRPDKADLQNGLLKQAPECIIKECPIGVVHVIDGGAMLQLQANQSLITIQN